MRAGDQALSYGLGQLLGLAGVGREGVHVASGPDGDPVTATTDTDDLDEGQLVLERGAGLGTDRGGEVGQQGSDRTLDIGERDGQGGSLSMNSAARPRTRSPLTNSTAQA